MEENAWKNFLHRYHFYTIIAPLSFLTSKTFLLFFFPNSYFWMLSSTFNFLLIFYFEYLLLPNTLHLLLLHLTYYYCFSTIDGFVVFHYVGDSLFFPDFLFFWFAVFTLINQLMQLLSSRGVLPNKCIPNVQKVVEKIYLWENSFLRILSWFAKVYEGKNYLLADSRKFIFANFYMVSKILSMRPKSLKLWDAKKCLIWPFAKVNGRKWSFFRLFAKVYVCKRRKFRDFMNSRNFLVARFLILK